MKKNIKELAENTIRQHIRRQLLSENYVTPGTRHAAMVEDMRLDEFHGILEQVKQYAKANSKTSFDVLDEMMSIVESSQLNVKPGEEKKILKKDVDWDMLDAAVRQGKLTYSVGGDHVIVKSLNEGTTTFNPGDDVYVTGLEKNGKVLKIHAMGDMADVDFGNGDIYGIPFRRMRPSGTDPISFNPGDKVYVTGLERMGTVTSIHAMGDMADVDFGNGDVYGVTFDRMSLVEGKQTTLSESLKKKAKKKNVATVGSRVKLTWINEGVSRNDVEVVSIENNKLGVKVVGESNVHFFERNKFKHGGRWFDVNAPQDQVLIETSHFSPKKSGADYWHSHNQPKPEELVKIVRDSGHALTKSIDAAFQALECGNMGENDSAYTTLYRWAKKRGFL